MPNDNTHTLLPCPFCGDTPAPIEGSLAPTPVNRHFNDGCPLSGLIFTDEEWNTRTPAEPKAGDWGRLTDADPITSPSTDPRLSSAPSRAGDWEKGIDWEKENAPQSVWDALESGGIKDVVQAVGDWAYNTALSRQSVNDNGDWEKEVEIHTAVEIHDRFQDDGIGDTEYVRLDEARALSSAAPRITEEMVEGILDGIRVRGNTDRHHGIRTGVEKAKAAMIALLRQQGAERKWISFGERLPDLGQPIFAKIRDSKSKSGYRVDSADFPKDMEPLPGMSIREWVGLCDWEAWTPRFVDTPPPFTPTQEGKP